MITIWMNRNGRATSGTLAAAGEFALIMTVYNTKRSINILRVPELMKKLKKWKPDYKRACWHQSKRMQLHVIGSCF